MLNKAQDDDLVMNLVELALARPEQERQGYLEGACAGDTELFERVWNYVQAEQRMNGFLLEPIYSLATFDHPFEPGELLDDRFRILREVAQGGMGIVYEAMDEKLNRRIALKCAKVGFHKRLPPEVRNATEISHPNVCKIFEIHTASTDQGEIDFLTMEFLEGETLAERLARGPLPEAEARTIARQLCAGLAEAHRNRVIHGDLKSSNIILTRGSDGSVRAVITDFGLARNPDAALPTLQSGTSGGTPEYMAPELWKGGKATVASDIYALGVILCELASGRRPYGEDRTGPVVTWEERLARKPPAVHPKWDGILARCLDPDPLRRFRDADEVAEAMAPRSRRWLWAAGVAAMLAIVTGVVTYERATAPKESVRLAMRRFESDRNTGAIADGLFRDTTTQLNRLRGNARTSFSIAALPAATHVLHGSLSKENEKVIVHAYLTDVHSGVNAREWRVSYAPGEVRYVPVALAGMVTGTLRLPTLAAGSAVNAAALKDYSSGLTYVRRDSGVDVAVAFLERAVAADPDSPLTYAGLAEAQWFKYFLTKDTSWLDRATASEREAERRNPDLAPVHRVAGILEANAGRYELAEAEYRRAIELEPGNGDGYRRLGMVLEQSNRPEEALAAYHRALEAEPSYYRTYQALGAFYSHRSDYSEAVKYYNKTVELAPDEANPHRELGSSWTNLGRFPEAESELRFALHLRETWETLYELGLALMYQSRDREAVPYFLSALKLRPESYFLWAQLGNSYRRLNQKVEAERAYRRGLQLADGEMSRNPRDGYLRSFSAYFCARVGDRERAQSEIAQALQLSSNAANVQWMAVVTYEALGLRESALAVLSSSPADLLADLSRWPDVGDLHKDLHFLQLLASHQFK